MLKASINISCFMEDPYSNTMEFLGDFYQKVKYSDSIVLLYMSDEEMSLSKMNLKLVGVYSLIKEGFICVVPNNCNNKLFFDENVDYTRYSVYNLNVTLNNLIQEELINVLNLQLKANTLVTNEIMDEAKTLYLNKVNPTYSFDAFKESLNLDNIEAFSLDSEDFAYNCAENLFFSTPKIKEIYQHFLDVQFALNMLKNDAPIEIELQHEISSYSKSAVYKNYNVVLTTNGNDEEETQMEITQILNYPLYAIKRIYWSRKLLFNIEDYDKTKVQNLRSNLIYNCEFVKKQNSYDKDSNLRYVEKTMFDNYDFCQCVVKQYGSTSYYRVGLKFKENISFISDSIERVGYATIIQNV